MSAKVSGLNSRRSGPSGYRSAAGRSLGYLGTDPFTDGDLTMGSETELQVVVAGSQTEVDLPLSLAELFGVRGDTPRSGSGRYSAVMLAGLSDYLQSNRDEVWESSLVRIPRQYLSERTWRIFLSDLLADKADPLSGQRSDAASFFRQGPPGELLRVPVSYLLKLGLSEALLGAPASVRGPGERWLGNFLNDNTSPETVTFELLAPSRANGLGRVVAGEKGMRLLLTRLIARYANRRFRLHENGQRVDVYLAPTPPVRQRRLAGLIPPALYRELFVNPCLAGWDEGEKKRDYMHLCHKVLLQSRSLAASALRRHLEGDFTRLVDDDLPDLSLANNGIHISIGSRALTAAREAGVVSPGEEKQVGDLTSKFFEHFLPLFTGLLSASPYRFGRPDLRSGQALGFLPHQLDREHLGVLWDEWQGATSCSFDGATSRGGGGVAADAAGIGVTDLRLLDFPVAPLSFDQAPSLDGTPGNDDRLKAELEKRGIFDRRMPLYSLYRLREYQRIGYSGFEARYYSLFEGLERDLAPAVDLQILITALATQLQLTGELSHADIPDTRRVESERRKLLFSAAIGLPVVLIEEKTPNRVLRSILRHCQSARPSRLHPGYTEVRRPDFQLALLAFLRRKGAPLIEMFGLEAMLGDLKQRIEDPGNHSVEGRLVRAILDRSGGYASAALDADSFNLGAERYYRDDLSRHHLTEAFDLLLTELGGWQKGGAQFIDHELFQSILPGAVDARAWLTARRDDLLADRLGEDDLRRLIHLTVLVIDAGARGLPGDFKPAEKALHAF